MAFQVKNQFEHENNLEKKSGVGYLNYDVELMNELIEGCFCELGYLTPSFIRHAYTKADGIRGKIRCATKFLEEFAVYYGLQVFYKRMRNGMKESVYVIEESDIPEKIGIPIDTMHRLNVPNVSSNP